MATTKQAQQSRMINVNIQEAKMHERGKFGWPACNAVFGSREAYDSHVMAKHQMPEKTTMEKTGMA